MTEKTPSLSKLAQEIEPYISDPRIHRILPEDLFPTYLVFVEAFGHSDMGRVANWGEGFLCPSCDFDQSKPRTRIPLENICLPSGDILGQRLPVWNLQQEGYVDFTKSTHTCYCPSGNHIIDNARLFLSPSLFATDVVGEQTDDNLFLVMRGPNRNRINIPFKPFSCFPSSSQILDLSVVSGGSIINANEAAKRAVSDYWLVTKEQENEEVEQIVANLIDLGAKGKIFWFGELVAPKILGSDKFDPIKLSHVLTLWARDRLQFHGIRDQDQKVVFISHSESLTAKLLSSSDVFRKPAVAVAVDPRSFKLPGIRRVVLWTMPLHSLLEGITFSRLPIKKVLQYQNFYKAVTGGSESYRQQLYRVEQLAYEHNKPV